LAKTLATVTEYLLGLVTLDDVTRNRNNPICVVQPKVAKARTMVSVTCLLLVAVATIIAIKSGNVNTA
jgi:hypothetical protein